MHAVLFGGGVFTQVSASVRFVDIRRMYTGEVNMYMLVLVAG